MALFENYSKRFIDPEDYKKRNFEVFFIINQNNGDKTFVTVQTKNYHPTQ